MNRLKQLLSNLRSSFWFVPSLVVLDSTVVALALIETDSVWGDHWRAQWPRLFGTEAEGARQMLSTLAGSMMSVMSITFSMTLLALALASSQYTSRILRNLMRSGVTQGTLGIFAGIFTYCLIVLRSIRGGEAESVPSLAVPFALVLALAGVVVLIFLFITSPRQSRLPTSSPQLPTIPSRPLIGFFLTNRCRAQKKKRNRGSGRWKR